MRWLRGWRPLLRLAWRDAWRAKGRSTLVLVMIALPVLAVSAADIVTQTSQVSSLESLDRRLGAADARISVDQWTTKVQQGADPDAGGYAGGGREHPLPTLADLSRTVGRPLRGIELQQNLGDVQVEVDRGVTTTLATEVDLTDPLAAGLFRIERGRAARSPDEVVVNTDLAERGPGLGERLRVRGGAELTVVGVGESTTSHGQPMLVAPVGALGLPDGGQRTWLVDAGGPVTWAEVRRLNRDGAVVLSRAVVVDPPSAAELPPDLRDQGDGGPSGAEVAVLVLVVSMALMEVVLLAGPAFAVGARRQSRALALMAASGGTPRQTRRAVLASALVLGGVGAVAGVLLGVAAARAVLPVAQRFSSTWFGPFEVPWLHLLGIAALGLLSALLAAVVPAWVASRLDVVAVLAGRRGDRRPSLRSPALGLLLLACGVGGAVYGATHPENGELVIGGSALVSVLGMTLMVPVLVVGLARASGRLPLAARFALRDAARHRTRTAPAVAAVAATVAGVVALGIALASQEALDEATYQPTLPVGDAMVPTLGAGEPDGATTVARIRAIVEEAAHGGTVSEVQGVVGWGEHGAILRVRGQGTQPLQRWLGSPLGSDLLVGDSVPAALVGLSESARQRGDDALRAGRVVVFADHDVSAESLRLTGHRVGPEGQSRGRLDIAPLPMTVVRVPPGLPTPLGVLPPAVARSIGVTPVSVAVYVTGAEITRERERDASEAIWAVVPGEQMYVERGYQPDDATRITIWVLSILAGLLMIGGSLTATFLSLADARPDLATLAAVGAAPSRRRGIAAAYALAVGLVGGVLGAAVGFIPGVAISYPLTGAAWQPQEQTGTTAAHYLAIPWPLISLLVLGLPVVTALIVGLATRSRLPMVARLT